MQQGCWQGIQCKRLINKAFSALKLEALALKAQPIEDDSARCGLSVQAGSAQRPACTRALTQGIVLM